MMGRQAGPAKLFDDFDLETHAPDDHLFRQVDRLLGMDEIRARRHPFHSHLRRPSIGPEPIVRMLIGYLTGIRSERRLCEEVHLNPAHRWFCRLGLDGKVPDHSIFSKYRHGKFRDGNLLRLVFEDVVSRCIEEGLVGGKGFGSKMEDREVSRCGPTRSRRANCSSPCHSTRRRNRSFRSPAPSNTSPAKALP